MFALLPPSLLYDMLTVGPLAMVNPQLLRLISKGTKKTIDAAFARPMFWQRLMQTCFPGLATRLPCDMCDKSTRFPYLDAVWHSYMRRAVADFRCLTVQVCFTGNARDPVDLPVGFYQSPFVPDVCCLAGNLAECGMCSISHYIFDEGVDNLFLNPGMRNANHHRPILSSDGPYYAILSVMPGVYTAIVEDGLNDVVLFVNFQELLVWQYEEWHTPFYMPPFPDTRGKMTVSLLSANPTNLSETTITVSLGQQRELATLHDISPNDLLYDVCIRLLASLELVACFPCKIYCVPWWSFTINENMGRPREGETRIGDIVASDVLHVYL